MLHYLAYERKDYPELPFGSHVRYLQPNFFWSIPWHSYALYGGSGLIQFSHHGSEI